MKSNLTIAVLCGGISSEREVSLMSGKCVQQALTAAGYNARLIDLKTSQVEASEIAGCDVAFPVLHGKYGEDGTIQSQLEAMGIPYVGSDAKTSKVCFDKQAYKDFLYSHDIHNAPQGALIESEAIAAHPLIRKPFVLKPYDGGSSIDTFIVRDLTTVDVASLQATVSKHGKMLLEELIEGYEITVAVLGNRALPVVEIIPPADQEFDYENKYNGATKELCPPLNVGKQLQLEAQQIALRIHEVTGCSGLSRTDMIVQKDGSIIVLETNTIPGMTEESLFPKAAKAAGYSFEELVAKLVELSVKAA